MLHNAGLQKRIEDFISDNGYKSYDDLTAADKVELAAVGIKDSLEPLSFLIESDDLHLMIKPLLKFMAVGTPANAYTLADAIQEIAVDYFKYHIEDAFAEVLAERKREAMAELDMYPSVDTQTGETRYSKCYASRKK